MEPFLGQIILFAGNFAPQGWAFCNGQLLSISENTALFSLLGTTYGGDGRTSFGLPDLRGRAPIHFGQGPGTSPYQLGQSGGTESVTLTTAEMPNHAHSLNLPASNQLGVDSNDQSEDYAVSAGKASVKAETTGATGGSQPHENRQPYIAVNYVIALQGIYPSRS